MLVCPGFTLAGSSLRAPNRPFCARGSPGAAAKGSAGAWTTAPSGKRRSVALPMWDLGRESPVVDIATCRAPSGCSPCSPGFLGQRRRNSSRRLLQDAHPSHVCLHERMQNQALEKGAPFPHRGPGNALTESLTESLNHRIS